MNTSSIGIIVLAAGSSSRMGEPKQLLRFEGETLLRRAVEAALETACRPFVVVSGAVTKEVAEELNNLETLIVVNELWTEGMGSSIRCGIRALEAATSGETQAAILTLCDQPFVTSKVINRLVEKKRVSDAEIIASVYGTIEDKTCGVPALFTRALFPDLMRLHGAEGAKRIIIRHGKQIETIAVPEAAIDIDSPEDYRKLKDVER